MSPNRRSWLTWLLPFLMSGGMAFGAGIGLTIASDAARTEGPAGDIAGATGALMIVICIVAGFVMATLAIIVAKVLTRSAPDRVLLRFGLSILGGGVIGTLGTSSGNVALVIAWLLLLGVPVLLSWSWRAKSVSEAKTLV